MLLGAEMLTTKVTPASADMLGGLSLAERAVLLGTATTIPVFRLIEPTEAQLQAVTAAEDCLSPRESNQEA